MPWFLSSEKDQLGHSGTGYERADTLLLHPLECFEDSTAQHVVRINKPGMKQKLSR